MYVYKSAVESSGITEQSHWRHKPHSGRRGGMARVSACEPLCAILLAKASVYPLSPVKANVGRLCKKLKIGMRNGLEQRCGDNFLAIFVGMVLGEKPNFLSRIFGQ